MLHTFRSPSEGRSDSPLLPLSASSRANSGTQKAINILNKRLPPPSSVKCPGGIVPTTRYFVPIIRKVGVKGCSVQILRYISTIAEVTINGSVPDTGGLVRDSHQSLNVPFFLPIILGGEGRVVKSASKVLFASLSKSEDDHPRAASFPAHVMYRWWI